MGGFTMANRALVDHFVEVVGFKSGLALSQARLLDKVGRSHPRIAASLAVSGGATHLSSVEHLEIAASLLHAVGVLTSPRVGLPDVDVERAFASDPDALALVEPVRRHFVAYGETSGSYLSAGDALGPNPFLVEIHGLYGDRGADVAYAFLRAQTQYQLRQPDLAFRAIDWRDQRDLEDLFASERLETQYGRFFDQRFIEYLQANFGEIDAIHWRQLEGVTAEYFDRLGFGVELGPGRRDGGVDVRVYPKDGDRDRPPLILVQCKRRRKEVDALVVKALHADVLQEQAQSGLIVTTSRLSPGADAVRHARAYKIEAADRATLRTWLNEMRRSRL